MNFSNYPYANNQPPYLQPGYYNQPMPDQLMQLRQQPISPSSQMQSGAVDDRIWVQGQGAATSYLVAANGFARLWDSTAPVFYEKQADAQGKPLPLRIFDYTERTTAPSAQVNEPHNNIKYITVDEFNELAERLTALENKTFKSKATKAEKKEKEMPTDE